MKLNFMLGNKDGKVELFNFTGDNNILFFFSNPFKLGFGYKKRIVANDTTTFTSYRFSARHFRNSPFGFTSKTEIQGVA